MIYLLFACFLVFFIADWMQIRRVRKHDGVLFPFCQLRREIMKYRYDAVMESPGTLSRKEIESLRRLSRVLDETIHNYNQHKTTLFNLRKMEKLLYKYRDVLEQVEHVNLTENEQIQALYNRFALCWAKAFIAYTPLIRSHTTLSLLALAFSIGGSKLRAQLENIRQQAAKVREDMQRYELYGEKVSAA